MRRTTLSIDGRRFLLAVSLDTEELEKRLVEAVRNRGDRPAGPFSITATGYPPIRSGDLAGGESRTFRSGLGCQSGTYHAL